MTLRRLYAADDGKAHVSPWNPELLPVIPGPGELSASILQAATAWMVVQAPAGGGHPKHTESGRRLVVVLSGEGEITASGETVVGRPGDLLLVEDTTGTGHSSRTTTGFQALMLVLD